VLEVPEQWVIKVAHLGKFVVSCFPDILDTL